VFIVPVLVASTLLAPVPAPSSPTHYQGEIRKPAYVVPAPSAPLTGCAKVWKTYPYGVGIKGAKDKVKTDYSPVKNFKVVTKAKFKSFAKLDSDKDKIACELPKYKNCRKVNSIYPNGLGLKGATDKTAGKRVTNFRITSAAIYNTNKTALDRDNDKIFCEKL
jgi:hypothetical protein